MTGTDFATRFALASLATWRVTHLLAEEDGPFDAVVRLRARAGSGQLGELLDCFYCLSIWTAAPASLAVIRRRRELPLVSLALSGAACLLERATAARDGRGADLFEPKGAIDELLWQETESIRSRPADACEPDRDAATADRGAPAAGRATPR